MQTVVKLRKGAEITERKIKARSASNKLQTTVEKTSTTSEWPTISDNRATPNKCTHRAVKTCNRRRISRTSPRTPSSPVGTRVWSMRERPTISFSSTSCLSSNSVWAILRFRLVVKELMHCQLQMAFYWTSAVELVPPTSLTWLSWIAKENHMLLKCRIVIRLAAEIMRNISRIHSTPDKRLRGCTQPVTCRQ